MQIKRDSKKRLEDGKEKVKSGDEAEATEETVAFFCML